ncbi:MAG TPA: DUF3106 domain-containing protein [Candidatus Binatia bacterium]|nr:DUF3106 domain-containing protein [Candidatus Binatia bacterium]
MPGGTHIPGCLAIAILAMSTFHARLSVAQKTTPHPVPAPQQHMSRPPATPAQGRALPKPQGHVGDWLRRYKDLPPDEQEQALKNDPAFLKLPPARQQILRQRLQHFSSLPPQRQLRILNRMETWEHLTPEQKQEAWQVFGQMRQLPPDRRRMVHTAIDDLRMMPPDQRENVISSDRFKGMFSDQERQLMRDATRLPLAPPDSGDQPEHPPEPGQPQE